MGLSGEDRAAWSAPCAAVDANTRVEGQTRMLPVSLIFASGVASGVNSYAAVLVLGLLGRFGHVTAIPAVLERPSVLAAGGVVYLRQFVAGKGPVVCSLWGV